MTQEQLNTALYNKMLAEQEKYKAWLLSQAPEAVLDNSYEYSCREDILVSLEENELTKAQALALLKSPCPLADVFKDWKKRDSSYHMNDIWDTVEARADTVIAHAKAGPER